MPSSRRPWLIAATVALAVTFLFLLAMMLGTEGRWSLPLDDSFIFFQYAKQMANGHPFQYNGGDPPSGGATSVTALLIDSVGYLVGFHGDGMVVFALLCGAAGLTLSLVGAWRFGRAVGMERPVLAALLVGMNGPLLWGLFAGMDLPLYVGGMLWTLASWAEEQAQGPGRKRTITWAALTAASRPEGMVFGLLAALLLFLEGPARRRAAWLIPFLVGLVPAVILFLFTGRPTPTSLQVKGTLGIPGMDAGTWLSGAVEYVASIVRDIYLGFEGAKPTRLQANNASGALLYLAPLTLVVWLAGLLPGAAREGSEKRPGPFLLGALGWLSAITVAALVVPRGYHWHRYLIPTYAAMLPFVAIGVERLGRGLAHLAPEAPPKGVTRAVILAWIFLTLPGTLYFFFAYAENSADIAFQQRALAAWCRKNLPADARLAVNDAGALRYDGIHPILDLEGLVSPWILPDRHEGGGSLWEALERIPPQLRPTHLVVYPNWYEGAMLEPHKIIYQQRILRQTIAGGNPMTVYEANWSLVNSGDTISNPSLLGELAGKTPIDRLDVADLLSERTHSYVYRTTEGVYQSLVDLQPGDDGRQILDGGRHLAGGESFRIGGATPGRDLRIVLRSGNGFRLHVSVDGADAGEWLEQGRGGANWVESSYVVPGSQVKSHEPRIEISLAEPHAGVYTAFHYWFYQ